MNTSGRRCAGCGSPLPETPDETRQITCAFCGLVNDLAHQQGAAPRPVTISVDVGAATRASAKVARTIGWFVFGIVAIILGSTAFGIYTAMKPVRTVLQTVAEQVTEVQRNVPRAQKVAPAELSTSVGLGWRVLDVAAPKSGWVAFEPVTDLGWAMAIAHAWQRDARLTRIDVDRLKDGGTLDLTGGPDNVAGYRFVSPAQIESWGRIADRDSKAEVPYELMIKLAEQKVTALVVRGQPRAQELPPPDVDTHPLPELLGLARHGRGFVEHPFYSGYLIHLEREGWVWYLRSLSGRESLPRIRARDGAVYPYRK